MQVDELINAAISTAERTEFSGVVSVFRGAETVLNQPFGYRDVKNRLANTAETQFGIASGTKTFTALGIGRLIEQGVLTLETRVGTLDSRYQGFIDPEATIQQLLTHTSGVFDYYDEETIEDFDNFFVEIPWSQLETPSDYRPLFEGRPMKFLAGERYAYSNGGYVFLGILIEDLTQQLYREFMVEQVLKPAGMGASGFFAFNDLPANTANGYKSDGRTTNIYNLPIRGGGDGGMYTTTADVRTFWHKLFAHTFLPPTLTDHYTQTHHRFGEEAGYGCGLYVYLGGNLFGMIGGDAGVGFRSFYRPQDQLVINVFSNLTNGEEAVSDVMAEILFAKDT